MTGDEIKALRQALHLTQEDFAHSLNVTTTTVNRWEHNRAKPSRLAEKALAELRERGGTA